MEALLYCTETISPQDDNSAYFQAIEDLVILDTKNTQQKEYEWEKKNVALTPEPTIRYVAPQRELSKSIEPQEEEEEEDLEKKGYRPYTASAVNSTIIARPTAGYATVWPSTAPSSKGKSESRKRPKVDQEPLLPEELEYLRREAKNLRYAWSELDLGGKSTNVGTPAYNRKMMQAFPHSFRPIGSGQMMDIIRSLRVPTIQPRPSQEVSFSDDGQPQQQLPSYWFRYVQDQTSSTPKSVRNTRLYDGHTDDDENYDDRRSNRRKRKIDDMQDSLGKLYQEMCKQDADDLSSARKRMDHWPVETLKKKVQSLEDEMKRLEEVEKDVLSKLKNPSRRNHNECNSPANTNSGEMEDIVDDMIRGPYHILRLAPPQGDI